MRAFLCLSWLVALLLGSVPAQADSQSLPEIKVRVGEAAPLRLGFVLLGAVCDDPSLLRIDDGGDHLMVVGLAPGKTKCGFWRDYGNPAPAAVYEVVVTGSER